MRFFILLVIAGQLSALPSYYNVYKLPDGKTPVVDGNLDEWTGYYFIDSIHSDDQVYARDSEEPWTPEEFQMQLYIAWDDNWAYFAIKVIRDDVIVTTSSNQNDHTIDNVKINPGGMAMGFYIPIDGSYNCCRSSPYVIGTSLLIGVNPTGNGKLPTYEWAIQKDLLQPVESNTFKFSIGSEDNDDYTYTDVCFLAVGAEYTGPKQDWSGNPWDNPLYYPTFTFVNEIPEPPAPAETHIFWYKAQTNSYSITDCFDDSTKGPCLPENAIIHEGMIQTGGVVACSCPCDKLNFGSGLDDQQGRCAFFWSRDLSDLAGSINSAKIRAEYMDGWQGNAFCNEGPINIRCGVVDFQGNIDTWGGVEYVPERGCWQDFLNPLSSSMGFDFMTPTLASEEVILFNALPGRPAESEPSVLDGRFFEIDVTDQVRWILENQGPYAIVLLVPPNEGNTGKVAGYADESCSKSFDVGSDSPWTSDGNTAHMVVNGDLEPVSIEKEPEMAFKTPIIGSPSPNPFNPATIIPFNTGKTENTILQIFNISGKLVFSKHLKGRGFVKWHAGGLPSGLYLLRAKAGHQTCTKRLILQK
jgi:hypothetical protein